MAGRDIRAGRAFVELFADKTKLERDLRAAEMSVKAFGKSVTAIGKQFLTIGALAAAAILPAVTVYAGFTETMSAVQAVSGATGDEFESLSAKAKELGATTSFSAKQVAEGMKFLGMAGFETQEILAGIPAVLRLARAGAVDLGIASDIASDVSAAFGLMATDMAHVADVMAATATSSNTTIEGLGESFKFAAPAGRAAGQAIEEVSAALGTLGSSGLKGSIAGRNLQIVFKQLANNDVQKMLREMNVEVADAEGNFRDLSDIMLNLQGPLNKLTEVERVRFLNDAFGESAKAAQILVSQASGFRELRDELNAAAGSAQNMSDIMAQNLAGDWLQFKSAAEGAAIALGTQLEPAIRGLLQSLTESIRGLTEWIAENRNLVVAATATAVAVGGIGAAMTAAGLAIVVVAKAIGGLKVLLSVASIAMGWLSKSTVATAESAAVYTAAAGAAATATTVWATQVNVAVASLTHLRRAITGTVAEGVIATTTFQATGGAIARIGGTVAAATTKLSLLSRIALGVGRVLGVVFTPVVGQIALVVAAIAGIGLGLAKLQKHFNIFDPLIKAFHNIVGIVKTEVLSSFTQLRTTVGQMGTAIGELASAVGTTLSNAFRPVGDLFTEVFGTIGLGLVEQLGTAAEITAKAFEAAWSFSLGLVTQKLQALISTIELALSGLEQFGLVTSRDERERGARLDRDLKALMERRKQGPGTRDEGQGSKTNTENKLPDGLNEVDGDPGTDAQAEAEAAAKSIADALKSFAESVKHSVQTPQEEFAEYMSTLQQAFSEGLISAEEFRRAAELQRDKLAEIAEREQEEQDAAQQELRDAQRSRIAEQVRNNVDLAKANGNFLGQMKELGKGAAVAQRAGQFDLAEELAREQIQGLTSEATSLEQQHRDSLETADLVTSSAAQGRFGLGQNTVDRAAEEQAREMRTAAKRSNELLDKILTALEM